MNSFDYISIAIPRRTTDTMMEGKITNFQFKHPFTCMVAGPTSSGKTVFVTNILRHHSTLISNLSEKPRILWCYGQWQASYEKKHAGVNINFFDGLPSEETLKNDLPDILVIDDLMTELGDNKKLADLFTKGSHHLNISIIFIVQNIFHQAKQMRTVSLNSHYLILMKNPRDKSQIYSLARQLYPTKMKFFLEAFEDATKDPYSYIKVDLHPSTSELYRLQTNIFPNESGDFSFIVYQPR